jgi:hypothetical protein
MNIVTARKDLLKHLRRFAEDKDRGISIALFSDLCGISQSLMVRIIDGRLPMSEWAQRRISKALSEWKLGKVAVMQNRDHSRYVEYRREDRPVARKTCELRSNGKIIQLVVGVKLKGDYSQPGLAETLRGDDGRNHTRPDKAD